MRSQALLEGVDLDDSAVKEGKDLNDNFDKQYEEAMLKRQLEENDHTDEENESLETEFQTPEMKRKAFLEAWKGMRGEKSEAEDGGFKPGVEIYFSHTESSLPPHGVSGKEWKKFKVTDVDWGK